VAACMSSVVWFNTPLRQLFVFMALIIYFVSFVGAPSMESSTGLSFYTMTVVLLLAHRPGSFAMHSLIPNGWCTCRCERPWRSWDPSWPYVGAWVQRMRVESCGSSPAPMRSPMCPLPPAPCFLHIQGVSPTLQQALAGGVVRQGAGRSPSLFLGGRNVSALLGRWPTLA
jgi:hypothetical protein